MPFIAIKVTMYHYSSAISLGGKKFGKKFHVYYKFFLDFLVSISISVADF